MGLTVLDAGVVIAGLDAGDALHAAAAAALGVARARGDSFTLPASAYAEILVRPAAQGAETVERADRALDSMAITVAPADRSIARGAAGLRARYPRLRLPDALVIATALGLDADHLLTTDQQWKALPRLGLRGQLTVIA